MRVRTWDERVRVLSDVFGLARITLKPMDPLSAYLCRVEHITGRLLNKLWIRPQMSSVREGIIVSLPRESVGALSLV
jgi:hypothetical protein